MDILSKYFPDLTDQQITQFRNLKNLYQYWNDKINLISRKDIDNIYERHVLHSLAVAKFIRFHPGTHVLDLGTGGGFPGIPLAILFPEVKFHLVDIIKKKINVVFTIALDLGLQNVQVDQVAAQDLSHQYDYVVTRAVTEAGKVANWCKELVKGGDDNDIPNGVIMLKGGDLSAEFATLPKGWYEFPISDYFQEPFFVDKYLIFMTP